MSITLDSLHLNLSRYYVKRRLIVEKITFNHRTFYAKFEQVNEPLTDTVFSQHLDRHYTIAASLLDQGKTNNLILEYRGSEPSRFYHNSKHLMHTLDIETYQYYEGKKRDYLLLFIPIETLTLEKADETVHKISDALEMRLTKEWKCFPDKTLPEPYNIITLPYREFTPQALSQNFYID